MDKNYIKCISEIIAEAVTKIVEKIGIKPAPKPERKVRYIRLSEREYQTAKKWGYGECGSCFSAVIDGFIHRNYFITEEAYLKYQLVEKIGQTKK